MKGSQDLKIKLIEHGSREYAAEVRLRELILRRPLGLEFSHEELGSETDSYHLGCFLQGQLLACLVLKPIDHLQIQMRQVAVEPGHQGLGIGSSLVNYSEQFAKQMGYRKRACPRFS